LLGTILTWAAATVAAQQTGGSDAKPEIEKEGRDYLLGINPFLPPKRLELTFAHMAARLSEALGREVHFRTSSTYGRFAERVAAGEYDMALVTPFLFVQLEPGTYVPLARAPGSTHGEFVTLENSPLEHLSDLQDQVLAVAPRGSVIDHLAVYTLLEQGLDPDEDVSVRLFENPLSCLQQLPAGTAAACVTNVVARERFAEIMDARLKVLGKTVSVPFGPFVAHRRVPRAEREVIRNLLMAWGDDPRNRLPVSGAQVPSLVPVTEGEYETVVEIWRALQER